MYIHLILLSIFVAGIRGEIVKAAFGDWYDIDDDFDSESDTALSAEDIGKTGSTRARHCDDVAIIGGGIAGAYTAWRLRNTNQSITVYEYSNRIGGRLHTSFMSSVPGFNAELGGMRFHIPSHPLLNKTVHDMGLTVQDFPLGYGASDNTLMYLRGVHLRYKELGSAKTPYRIGYQQQKAYSNILWDVFVNNTDYNQHKNRSPFFLKTKDGIPLFNQSIQSVFAKYVSTELAQYIKDVNSFLSDFGTTSAAYALPASDPIIPGESMSNLKTVKEGMNEIPRRLLQMFKHDHTRHTVLTNHHLQSMKKNLDGTYQLHFNRQRNPQAHNHCAKKVILAINRLALEKLSWPVLQQSPINDLITKSVRDARAVKFFLAYDHPWWKSSHYYDGFAISDTPLHRTYDFGSIRGSNISVLNAVYSDNDISLWEELIKRGPRYNGTAVHKVTDETIGVIQKYLAAIYDIDVKTIPKPIGGIIGLWNAYPIGGAWQEWLPGYVMPDVEKQMVKPSASDEVYVASNAFNSDALSFWCESSLQASELVLKHFNV